MTELWFCQNIMIDSWAFLVKWVGMQQHVVLPPDCPSHSPHPQMHVDACCALCRWPQLMCKCGTGIECVAVRRHPHSVQFTPQAMPQKAPTRHVNPPTSDMILWRLTTNIWSMTGFSAIGSIQFACAQKRRMCGGQHQVTPTTALASVNQASVNITLTRQRCPHPKIHSSALL